MARQNQDKTNDKQPPKPVEAQTNEDAYKAQQRVQALKKSDAENVDAVSNTRLWEKLSKETQEDVSAVELREIQEWLVEDGVAKLDELQNNPEGDTLVGETLWTSSLLLSVIEEASAIIEAEHRAGIIAYLEKNPATYPAIKGLPDGEFELNDAYLGILRYPNSLVLEWIQSEPGLEDKLQAEYEKNLALLEKAPALAQANADNELVSFGPKKVRFEH